MSATTSIRVLLADDHALFREGVRALLEGHPGIEVVGEVNDGLAAVAMARELRPDVVLMDVTMPALDGVEATRRITAQSPAVRVLIVSGHDDEQVFFRALSAGAAGYILKRSSGLDLVAAIRATRDGYVYLSPYLARALLRFHLDHERGPQPQKPEKPLSGRESEVLRYIAEGKSSREIAEELTLSIKTVHNHRTRLMTKLGLHRNADLVKYAIRLGMVEVS